MKFLSPKSLPAFFAAFFFLSPTDAADFTVSNVGMTAYNINGASNPTLTLQRGTTYVFAVSAPGHPFDIKTNSTIGSVDRYTNGVTGQGMTSGNLTFVVPTNAPDSLFYHCEIHTAMAGSINIVNPPNLPPTVTITNPASGTVFIAPASVTIQASAADVDGIVTNVQFLTGSNVLTNETTTPFSFITNNLAMGNYTFSAIASDNFGAETTNIVAISVATPLPLVISSPQFSSAGFQFSYAANIGLSYVIQQSTDLAAFNWINLFTNTATSNPVIFMDNNATNNPAFYRVGLLPNQ